VGLGRSLRELGGHDLEEVASTRLVVNAAKLMGDGLDAVAACRVALVEWPKPNVFALGFVTGQCELKGDKGDRIAIYIPTVPNPTSGMFALISRSEVYDTDISVEEALKLVLSGGIVRPDKLNDVDVKARWKNQEDPWSAQEQFSMVLNDHRNKRRGYNGYNYRGRHELYRVPANGAEERW